MEEVKKKKKAYVKPELHVEEFTPNEYISACTDTTGGTIYKFVCDAGSNSMNYGIKKDGESGWATISGYYMNGKKDYYTSNDQKHTGYRLIPCNATLEAAENSGFLTGYHLDDADTKVDENIPIIIWTNGGSTVHGTTNIKMDTWEKNMS